jgi:protein O-mannosyl-transferase
VLRQWIDALSANPAMASPGRQQDAAALAGRLALLEQRPDEALAHFDRGLAVDVRPEAAAQQAALLARHGHYQHALAHLDHYDRLAATMPPPRGFYMPRLHRWVLERQGYWEAEFEALRRQLRADLEDVGLRADRSSGQAAGDAAAAIRHTADP